MFNIKLLRKNELVKFIQKIGHHQAARIIEEHNIDGSEILNLTSNDISKWHLTVIEEEVVWKCINQLKLNYTPKIDYHKCTSKKITSEPKHTRQSIHNYFKFKPNKKQSSDFSGTSNVEQRKKLLLESFENLSPEFDTEMFNGSGYPALTDYNTSSELPLKRNEALIEQLKKYLTFNSNRLGKYQLLTTASNSYIDLSNLIDNNCIVDYMSENYETSILTMPDNQTISSSQHRKLKHTKCYFKLCCFFCGFDYEYDDKK